MSQSIQTGSYQLDFRSDPEVIVGVYADALLSVSGSTPGTVCKLFVVQYSPGGHAISFSSGFNFVDNTAPVLGANAGSQVTVYFSCTSAGSLFELRREVVDT